MNKQLWWKLKLKFSLIPGFITSFPQSTVYCNIIFKTVLSDDLMNKELISAKAGNETKIKATSGLIALLSFNYSCVMLPSKPLKVALR